jgi:hypothetical protein
MDIKYKGMRVIKVIAYELININRKKRKRTIKRERKEKREEN